MRIALTDQIISKSKQIIFLWLLILLALLIATPYLTGLYLEQNYFQLIKQANQLSSDLKVSGEFERKYWNSSAITHMHFSDNPFVSNVNLKKPHNLIIMQHTARHIVFSKKLLANIESKITSGLPMFFKQDSQVKFVTTMDFTGKVKTIANGISLYHLFAKPKNSFLEAPTIFLDIEQQSHKTLLKLTIQKLLYGEHSKRTEIDGLKINLTLNKLNSKLDVMLSSNIDRLYLSENHKPFLRMTNFSLEQNFTKALYNLQQLNANASFAQLNIYDQKFGPLATKWQINDINLSALVSDFVGLKLPLEHEKVASYQFLEASNKILRFRPNVNVDLLLNTAKGKLKLISDVAIGGQDIDFLNKNEVLDSMRANLAAGIPKEIFFELVTYLLEEKLMREAKMPNAEKLTAREFQNKLESLVRQRVGYLLKNKIVKENDDHFYIDLSIAQGTFYSRLNPFKVFSF